MNKILIVIFLIFSNLILAQVKFETRVLNDTLPLNENLRVEFIMNIKGENFKKPSFKGFNIVKEFVEYESWDWEKNKMISYKKVFSYILSPIKIGNLRIQKATVVYLGKVYKTQVYKVKVLPSIEK